MSNITNVENVKANPPYALISRRFLARLIDYSVVNLAMFIITTLMVSFVIKVDFNAMSDADLIKTIVSIFLAFILTWGIYLVYEVVAISRYGATLGKKILKLKVVNSENFENISLGDSFKRSASLYGINLISIVVGLLLPVGGIVSTVSIFGLALININGRHVPDYAGNSVVISTNLNHVVKKVVFRRVLAGLLVVLALASGQLPRYANKVFNDTQNSALTSLAKQNAKSFYKTAEMEAVLNGGTLTDEVIDETVLNRIGEGSGSTWEKSENKYTIYSGDLEASVYICLTGVSLEKCA